MGSDIFTSSGSLLITGTILKGRPVDIAVNDAGTIAGVVPAGRGEKEFGGDRLIIGERTIAIPGLVNTHTHAAMTLLRGYADDMPLQPWLNEKIWPLEAHLQADDVYWGTRLACLEMIKSGTVAFNDMYFFMQDAARAVADSGLRATLAYGFIDLGDPERREHEISATERLIADIRRMDNPRIRPAVGPHSIYTVSSEGLGWCADTAREMDLILHIHLSETETEVRDCLREHGVRPAVWLDRHGCLSRRTVAAHCCWLDSGECRLLGERGVHASYNPASNMKLSVNRALPYSDLSGAGVNISLGTDGCASNNNLDLFEEMKIAALLQKMWYGDPRLLPAPDAMRMAGAAGHRALGLSGGVIEPGRAADIVLVDMKAPAMVPCHHPYSNIVYSCSGSAVRTTICDGRVLMHDRLVPDEEEILKEAARAAADLVARATG
ncbi:MAG: amidohydrolase [Methanoculleaceae archaeon]